MFIPSNKMFYVVMTDLYSSKFGVPQGPILRPLSYKINILLFSWVIQDCDVPHHCYPGQMTCNFTFHLIQITV